MIVLWHYYIKLRVRFCKHANRLCNKICMQLGDIGEVWWTVASLITSSSLPNYVTVLLSQFLKRSITGLYL